MSTSPSRALLRNSVGVEAFDLDLVGQYLTAHPYELLFVTASGGHLYGFASPDSDYDLRGAHVIPASDMLRIDPPRETYEVLDRDSRIEMDVVTHDVRKFLTMLLSRNGYVLEQIFSPLVFHASEHFEELKSISARCLTRNHHYHFESFARKQWDSIAGPSAGTVKGLLYTYRPLLAGIALMTDRRVESNIVTLNERFRLGFIDELVELKRGGAEKQELPKLDMEFHERQFVALREQLLKASAESGLPDQTPEDVRDALNDLLLRLRRVG